MRQGRADSRCRDIFSPVARAAVWSAAGITAASLLAVCGYILCRGLPQVTPRLFAWRYTTENLSLLPAAVNTLLVTALSLGIALPVGAGAAVWLNEYAPQGSRLVRLVLPVADTLSGIPSVVYGLFGSLFFVRFLRLGLSLLSGALTVAIMLLPLIMRTTQEALAALPQETREGSLALGAGRLRTVLRVVLPEAMPGILSGVILAIGRVLGESAALIFTAGTAAQTAGGLLDSGRTLSVHIYAISGEGLYPGQTYASAAVLLTAAAAMNVLSAWLSEKIAKGRERDG